MNIPKEFQKSEEELFILDKYGIIKKTKAIDFDWDYLLGVNLGYFYGCFISFYPKMYLEPSELKFIKKCKLAMISEKNNLVCLESKSNYKSPIPGTYIFKKGFEKNIILLKYIKNELGIPNEWKIPGKDIQFYINLMLLGIKEELIIRNYIKYYLKNFMINKKKLNERQKLFDEVKKYEKKGEIELAQELFKKTIKFETKLLKEAYKKTFKNKKDYEKFLNYFNNIRVLANQELEKIEFSKEFLNYYKEQLKDVKPFTFKLDVSLSKNTYEITYPIMNRILTQFKKKL
jgi:hypothetical protein